MARKKQESDRRAARFGHVEGVPVGKTWPNREGLRKSHVHMANMAGIYGSRHVGAFSVVLRGDSAYADEDRGETFTYIGSGGRESGDRDGPQVIDQDFKNHKNKALEMSAKRQKPVRVTRGVGQSKWAPNSGFRYDGLYMVTNPRREMGPNGFYVCKFDFTRCRNQAPLPVDFALEDNSDVATRRRLRQEDTTNAKDNVAGPSRTSDTHIAPIVDLPVEEALAPVREHLKGLSMRGQSPAQKLARRKHFLLVGRRVCAVIAEKEALGQDPERWTLQLWNYVSLRLPAKKVHSPEETREWYIELERRQTKLDQKSGGGRNS